MPINTHDISNILIGRQNRESAETDNTTENHGNDELGDLLEEDKPEGITRLYFQNLNGLKWDKKGGTWPMVCQAMTTIQADITCFAEVNQDTSQLAVRHRIQAIATKHFKHHKIVASTSTGTARKTYKPRTPSPADYDH